MNSNFQIMLHFKGYGNPNGSYWFIGMEESKETKSIEVLKTYESGLNSYPPGWYTRDGADVSVYRFMAEFLRLIEEKDHMSRVEYLDYHMFQSDGSNFYTLLKPLGKPKYDQPLSQECLDFHGLFNYEEYHALTKSIRYPFLRKLIEKYNPKVICCFGKGFWSEYKNVLEINESNEVHDDFEYASLNGRHIYLCHFFGQGMPYERIRTMTSHYKNL